MSRFRPPGLSRRGLLTAFGGIGAGALVTACGGGGGSGTAKGGGTWAFTDDRGRRVTTGGRPRRLVAYVGTAAALHDLGLGDRVVGVFGPTKLKDGSPDPLAGSLDVTKVTVLGNTFGEFNVEKYAALRPDLLVTNMYLPNALWYVPDNSKDKITALAPSVAVTAAKVTLTEPIRRYEELAASLGADLKARQVTDARARFGRAAETLRAAARAKGGLKVLAASCSPDLFYVSDPNASADLRYFRSLGVDLIVPDKVSAQGFFEELSWENADKYPADLILLDARTSALQPEDLAAKPTWAKLPAVKAGQVTAWQSEPRFSHAGCAPLIESLAAAVQKAAKVR
ncbi:ABC transporter substrate-binding protein [Actinoallomurus spadix]|uniref:Siderophore-binding protein DesE n=1 Tax=Actinoallomurus spadix TaxID=79912 RepID=A0ABP3FQF8_9ACTN|nr:ABC transporter substrate-binding protein [Actinoallomurus spadix]MCO5988085.1 ABC transporter substrate-binding protein [Actinoallomurus spadix]